jgi:hypothetical protein
MCKLSIPPLRKKEKRKKAKRRRRSKHACLRDEFRLPDKPAA